MSSSELVRWSGLAAMAAGVLYILAELLDLYTFGLSPGGEVQFSAVATTASFTVEVLLLLVGDVLLLFALFGLYVSQSEAATAPLLSCSSDSWWPSSARR